jgi:hypothetical protein
MNKPRRRVQKNFALRQELIGRGLIIPQAMLPAHLKAKGFHEAARVASERVLRGLPLFVR